MSFSLVRRQKSEASEGQHRSDVAQVGLVHVGGTTQVALVLRGLLREDVALERLTALDGTTRTDAEPLGRALLGLHLGHGMLLCCTLDQASAANAEATLLVCLPGLWGRARHLHRTRA